MLIFASAKYTTTGWLCRQEHVDQKRVLSGSAKSCAIGSAKTCLCSVVAHQQNASEDGIVGASADQPQKTLRLHIVA